MREVFEKIIEKLEVAGKAELIAHSGRCNGKTLALGYTKGISDAIEIVKQEAEKCNNDWIPCSERLPEDGVDVLVWFEYFRYGHYNRMFRTVGISYTYDGEWSGFVNGSSGWRDLTIFAWQPLPEPYRPKEII